MHLVIVESPAKAKTIEKFLGKPYKVLSSYGHIRDLPRGNFGIDIENNFQPKYVIPTKARKNVNLLKKEAEKAEKVILATDEDREGEAISWHLASVLNLKDPERITFHEITKEAIKKAINNPRKININLVNAQQARRVLDRIVGYKLSPFLWEKVAKGLSAGRVQSVALRLIAEREKEIKEFKPEEYWTIEVLLKKQNSNSNSEEGKKEFSAILIKKDGETIPKLGIKTKKEAESIVNEIKGGKFIVENIEKKEVKKNPLPPFTTSTLQQESFKKLGWTAKKTMLTAQHLYEKGFITYHRTDSLNLSEKSLIEAKKIIEEKFGKNYWAGYFRKYKTKNKTSQEAHEAIRPTSADFLPKNLDKSQKKNLDSNEEKLYELIWKRFLASQMSSAIFITQQAEISAKNYIFKASGQTIKFEGFLKVYQMKITEKIIPPLSKREELFLKKINPLQHFTQPPSRYSEASLIKELEEKGIGRPSTYAPIISTIQERNYVVKNQQKKFEPTEIGIIVNNILVKHFPEIVDIKFTAKMEENLDKIAGGEKEWTKVCQEFYSSFAENLEKKYKEVSKQATNEEETDKICPKCGSPLTIKFSRFGKFYACSSFPKCRYTEPLEKKSLNAKCPKCQKGEIIEKKTRKGKIFFACDKFPNCSFAVWDKPVINENNEIEKCPKCQSFLIEKGKKIKCSNKNCDFEKNMKE